MAAYISKGYSLKQQLGAGSSGAVYLVEKLLRSFAMKEINIQMSEEEKIEAILETEERRLERAKTEIAILQKLKGHRNILSIVEPITDSIDKLYIVTEYCQHGDLEKVINSGDPGLANERFIAIVMTQLCCGIQFMHSKNVLHNNIMIKNIFVQSGGVIKTGDFGLSEELTGDATARSDAQAFKSDMNAVGGVLFELGKRVAQIHLNEIQGDPHYLKTLTERIWCTPPRLPPTAAAVHPFFRLIERKLRQGNPVGAFAGNNGAAPAVGGNDTVSIIINSWDNWISTNEGGDNVNDNVDDGDNDLNSLVEIYLPW